jgi:membrane associated rhomboid family serine protease
VLLPYSTERRLERVPWATIILIAANVIVAGVTWTSPELMLALIYHPSDFHWYQPLTSLFIHAGPFHLAGNMLCLWVFGSHVEDALGARRFLLIYLSSGLCATALQGLSDLTFLHHLQGGLGASGAVMGVVALCCTRFRKVKVNILYWVWVRVGTFQAEALWVAIAFIALEFILGIVSGAVGTTGGVAHFAHVGGFMCGLAWTYALRIPDVVQVEEVRHTADGFAKAGAHGAAGLVIEEELEQRPYDADLHVQAAEHLAMEPKTFDRAVEHWNAALRLWVAQGQTELACERWLDIGALCPADALDPETAYTLALGLEHAGEVAEAVRLYTAVAQAGADLAEGPAATLRLADLLATRGADQQARRWYEHLAATWPESGEALEAPARIHRLERR